MQGREKNVDFDLDAIILPLVVQLMAEVKKPGLLSLLVPVMMSVEFCSLTGVAKYPFRITNQDIWRQR